MNNDNNIILDDRDVKRISDAIFITAKFALVGGTYTLTNGRISSNSVASATPNTIDGQVSVDGDFIPYGISANCSAGTCVVSSSNASDTRTINLIIII